MSSSRPALLLTLSILISSRKRCKFPPQSEGHSGTPSFPISICTESGSHLDCSFGVGERGEYERDWNGY